MKEREVRRGLTKFGDVTPPHPSSSFVFSRENPLPGSKSS